MQYNKRNWQYMLEKVLKADQNSLFSVDFEAHTDILEKDVLINRRVNPKKN